MNSNKVIAIVNQKGGVAKTVTALNLGYALSEMGKKVLLIDFNPQSSLTVCFGYDNTDNISTTIY
ncbi:ParA family protein [Clostridium saccharoperbutylacetonicum]|uniref:ParA family protein n=1 Tax=Clostridium saccharoperbutylacetonicum TaxID=36745 RepID=UPI0039EB58E9